MYSQDSTQIPTAVRAIWLLYQRGKWEQLRQVGIRRSEVERPLNQFSQVKTGASPDLVGKRQLYSFLQAHRAILEGAVRMVGVYMILYSEEVQYERSSNDRTNSLS